MWDASTNGPLPSAGVSKGNAYNVVNAPSDGSGRFGEVMQNDDWVVWDGETYVGWSVEPHQWFVIPAHEVRRITALERNFLTDVEVSAESDRNPIVRGANYADSAGEIRIKLYATRGDYAAADLNTTGDIDEYTNPTNVTGVVAIRLTGTQSTLASVLPTLYVYREDSSGAFTRLLNLDTDFSHQGDFTGESDYLSHDTVEYTAGDTLRIYIGQTLDRYNLPLLDVNESNLSDAVQVKLNRIQPGDDTRIDTLESKVNALFPLTVDVADLTGWADIYNTENTTATVRIVEGYSLIADYRGPSTKYESSGVVYDDSGTNVVTYTGLTTDLRRAFGFKVTGAADQVLMWLIEDSTEPLASRDRIPFVDMTAAGSFRVNNYTPAYTEDQRVENLFFRSPRTSGVEDLSISSNDVSTHTVQPFPANATETSRYFSLFIDIYEDGTNTQAEHGVEITLPADNTARAATEVTTSVYLGPLHQNRTVTVTFSHALRVSGSDLLIDFRLVRAPSNVTIRIDSPTTFLSYTAPATVARVDSWQTFNDGGGDYTFTGEQELLLVFHPFADLGFMNAVPAAVGSNGIVTELNDVNVPIPHDGFGEVEIPDTTAVSGLEFRTFLPNHYLVHHDLRILLGNRATQWAYGLALLAAVTEHAVTELVDFTQGIILISPNSTRYKLTVANDGTLKTEVAP